MRLRPAWLLVISLVIVALVDARPHRDRRDEKKKQVLVKKPAAGKGRLVLRHRVPQNVDGHRQVYDPATGVIKYIPVTKNTLLRGNIDGNVPMLVLEDPKEEKPRQKKDDKKASPFLAGLDDRLETVEIEGSDAETSKHLGKDGKPIDYTEGGKWAFEKANEDKSRRPKLVGLKSRAARPQDGQQLPNDEGDNINLPQEGNMGGNVQSEGEPGIGDEQRGIGEGTERDGKQSQETGSQQKPPQPEKNQAELDREEAARKAQEESDAQGGGPGIGQGAGPQGGGGDPSLVTIPSNAGGDDGAIEDDKDPGDDNWQGPGEDGAGGEDKPDDGEDQPEGTDDEDKPPIGDGAEPDEEEEEDKPDDDDDKVTVKPAKDGYPPDGEYQRVAPLAINGDLYWVLRAVPCKKLVKGKWVDEKPGYIDVPGKKQRILYYGEPFLRKLKNPPPCSKENPCQPGGHPRPRTFHHRRPVAQYQYVYGRK